MMQSDVQHNLAHKKSRYLPRECTLIERGEFLMRRWQLELFDKNFSDIFPVTNIPEVFKVGCSIVLRV